MVVADNARNVGHVHKLPYRDKLPNILTGNISLSVEQAAVVAVLLSEAQDDGWNAALASVKQYCERVEVKRNVRAR